MDWLTPQFLVAALALVTSISKIWSDRKEKKKTSIHELGKAAWLMMVGAQSVLPNRKEAIEKWRRIAEDLASAWGMKISDDSWVVLEDFKLQRY